MDLDCLLVVFSIMRQPLHIALPAGKDGTRRIDATKVLLRRSDPSVRLQLVLCSTKKDCARCGRWDASFRLLATPLPTTCKACTDMEEAGAFAGNKKITKFTMLCA
jgi:hypothetical protein